MPTEYWLQKRTFNSWSHVTWYASLEEAKSNFERAKGNGYSWRIMKCEVVEECLNEGERAIEPETPEPVAGEFKSDWGGPAASGWGKPAVKAAPVAQPLKSEHGLVGSVWVGNPSTKEKKRVPAEVANAMLNEGWVRAGPRTVL